MPKGHKLVDWSQPGNDTRLLLSIVQTHSLDYGKIAAAFGKPDKPWLLPFRAF